MRSIVLLINKYLGTKRVQLNWADDTITSIRAELRVRAVYGDYAKE